MSESSDRETTRYTIHPSPNPFQHTVDGSGTAGISKIFKVTPAGNPNPQVIRVIGERHTTRPLMTDRNDDEQFMVFEIGATGSGIEAMDRIDQTARDIVRVLNAFDDPNYVSVLYPNTP